MKRWIETRLGRLTEWIWKLILKTRWMSDLWFSMRSRLVGENCRERVTTDDELVQQRGWTTVTHCATASPTNWRVACIQFRTLPPGSWRAPGDAIIISPVLRQLHCLSVRQRACSRLQLLSTGPCPATPRVTKGKGKGLDTCYSATYMSQTRDQQRFTISEVAADWHEPMVPQRIMCPSIARANRQMDPRCS